MMAHYERSLHGTLTTRRISTELRRLADGYCPLGRRDEPAVWKTVADRSGLAIEPRADLPGGSLGRLLYLSGRDTWIIQYRPGMNDEQTSRVFVHELAHWYQRAARSEWLCGERETVYYYEGDPASEQHALARRIENLIVRKAGAA